MAGCFNTTLGFGHNLAGQICTNPEWLPFPLTLLAAVAIVVLFVFGSNIWVWAQMKRRQGGVFNILLWIVGSLLALLGIYVGWMIGFVGVLIIIGTVIAFFRK